MLMTIGWTLCLWLGQQGDSFVLGPGVAAPPDRGNRLAYLDDPWNPFWPGRDSPRLITPQWIGEDGVDAAIVLSIDDLRETGPYEAFLEPARKRLMAEFGRTPLSILVNSVDTQSALLQQWLKDGISLEIHTLTHPCPCLTQNHFERAKATFDGCVDLLHRVAGNVPVAFRMPCCDSMNSTSPRFFAEIFARTTPEGHFLTIDSSVFVALTPSDPELARDIVLDGNGVQRFDKYVSKEVGLETLVYDYPYPYLIGGTCLELPCIVPSDWQAQRVHGAGHAQILKDMQRALDGVVAKKGVFTLVFHPYGWMQSIHVAELVDYALRRYGSRVRFLSFRDVKERIEKNLFAGQPLRAIDGGDEGVRLVDVDADGLMDVVVANDSICRTRVFDPERQVFTETQFPAPIARRSQDATVGDGGVRFGILDDSGHASVVVHTEEVSGIFTFEDQQWLRRELTFRARGPGSEGDPTSSDTAADSSTGGRTSSQEGALFTSRDGLDQGARLKDLDHDGRCELIVSNHDHNAIFTFEKEKGCFRQRRGALPAGFRLVDEQGRDGGVRFVDVDHDGDLDLVRSDVKSFALHLFSSADWRADTTDTPWSRVALSGDHSPATVLTGDAASIPAFVRADGSSNGAWFGAHDLFVQNEQTGQNLPRHLARRSFRSLVAGEPSVPPRDPFQALHSFEARPGFRVELMACEPLVMDPIAFELDADGSLWVVEMADYPLGLDDQGKAGGRIRHLLDTDGDGRFDRSDLFAEGLPFPTSIHPWKDGVLVTAAPELLFLADRDGDSKAEIREAWYSGFTEGNTQHRVNGFALGLDGWLYLANGDSGGKVRSHRSGDEVEIQGRDLCIEPLRGGIEAIFGMTQFGRCRNDSGDWFGCNNAVPGWHFVLEDHYLRRNPLLLIPEATRELTGERSIHALSRVMSHWEGYRAPPEGEPGTFTSACSLIAHRDEVLGPGFENSFFLSEPVHNAVHRLQVVEDGISYRASRAGDERFSEFLASTDPWFRPTSLRFLPDGALWIADMYRLVIEHPEWIDDEAEKTLFLREGCDRGRIFRVLPMGAPPRTIPNLRRLSGESLAARMDSASGWQRDTVQRLLMESGDSAAIPVLKKLAGASERWTVRLQSLATLSLLATKDPGTLRAVLLASLGDEHPAVRRHAVRLCEPFLEQDQELVERVAFLADDPHPKVQLQVAYSLGECGDRIATQALHRLLWRWADDERFLAAIMSSAPRHVHRLVAGMESSLSISSDPEHLRRRVRPLLRLWTGQPSGAEQILDGWINAPGIPAASSTSASTGNDRPVSPVALMLVAEMLLAMDAGDLDAVADRLALSTASRKRLCAFLDLGFSAAFDESLAVATRKDALALARWVEQPRGPLILSLATLLAPRTPADLQIETVERLCDLDEGEGCRPIFELWKTLSPAVRRAAIQEMLRSKSATESLLTAIEKDPEIATTLDLEHKNALLFHTEEQIHRRASSLLTAASSDRAGVLDQYRDAALKSGDPDQGAALYSAHCAKCHRLGNLGRALGPDLSVVADPSPQTFLVAILDPNRAIEARYLQYLVSTGSGELFSGMITQESESSITLEEADQPAHVIARSDIRKMKSSGVSPMPIGVEQSLPPAAMADLIAFLMKSGAPPKVFEGNRPVLIEQAPEGNLTLAASTAEIRGPSAIFESRYGNIGFWSSPEDSACWSLKIDHGGRFRAVLDYACAEGPTSNHWWLKVADQELRGAVTSSGTWDDYRVIDLGTVTLPAGVQRLSFRSLGPIDRYLVDLRTLTLEPVR